jgi:hypothetical protein
MTACDSAYYALQDLSVDQIRGNEIWVDYFLRCEPGRDTLGGFVLSAPKEDGNKDRIVIARYQRGRWGVRLVETAMRIRLDDAMIQIDLNEDGIGDYVFRARETLYPSYPILRVAIMGENGETRIPALQLHKGMAVDSILPAPPGRARPLIVIDRRGWDIGGFDSTTAPTSYRYLEWNPKSDPPDYVNMTDNNRSLFPEMARRAAFFRSLPVTDSLKFRSVDEYREFAYKIIGYCLDESNCGRELESFEKVADLLQRTKVMVPAGSLALPKSLMLQIKRVLPMVRGQRVNQQAEQLNKAKDK